MSSTDSLPPRRGAKLDAERLDFELGRRGVTARKLASVAGVPEVTLSRARHGRRVSEATLRRITTALAEIPVLSGVDLILAAPETSSRPGAHPEAATTEDSERGRALEPA